jgi:exopolyphosphatase/pppGpp-phosphohydrolase
MNDITEEKIRKHTQQVYDTFLQTITDDAPITLLHIDNEFTCLVSGTDKHSPKVWMLDIGAQKTAKVFFKHNPPTPGEVENAIATIEDEVMPIRKLVVPNSRLFTSDDVIREIARCAFPVEDKPEMILPRTTMEQVFGRLGAIISGRPASLDILPTTNTFASTLLILREVMYHIGFEEITIL